MILRKLLCVGLGLAVAAPALAAASLTADQIVARNAAARGGLSAWRAVKRLALSGEMDAGRVRADPRKILLDPRKSLAMAKLEAEQQPVDQSDVGKVIRLPFVMDLARPRQSRLELKFQGQTAVQVYDGERGWKLRPFLGRHEVEAFTPEELKQAAAQQDLDGPLIDAAAKGSRVALEGVEAVEGRDAYKLRVTLKDGQVRRVWVDAETFLDVKIDGVRRVDGRLRPMLTYLRDYRKVDGLMIPFTLETRVEGVKDSETISVDNVAVNPPFDAATFAKPL